LNKASNTGKGKQSSVQRDSRSSILGVSAAAASRAGTRAGLLRGLRIEGNAVELALNLSVAALARRGEALKLVARFLDVRGTRDIEGTLDVVKGREISPK
jgi:hypothetical protein